MITINYLGNEFIREDSSAIVLAQKLREKYKDRVVFSKIDTFSKLVTMEDNLNYMDVCEGISRAKLITDIDEFSNMKTTTAHDLDFGFFLKLNKKLGNIKKANIICLPMENYQNIEKDVCNLIEKVMGNE
jgi:Ni,Fe-hydrogenase maturation factor